MESPLRARHGEYAQGETTRRTAAIAQGRGGGEGAHIAEVLWIPWGETAEIVGVFDRVETEYAAIRRGAAICDQPQRGTIEIRGANRVEFLQRMLTQDMKGVAAGDVREAFWLNRKGRIEGDLLLCELGDRMLVDCAGAVAATIATALRSFIFSEDVTIDDTSARDYRLAVHGPSALHLLELAGAGSADLERLREPLRCAAATIAGVACVLARVDRTGECGIEVFLPRDGALAVWNALLAVHDVLQGGLRRGRPCGWSAFNIARIEAGTPMFEIDFGTSSLPAETGIIDRRVSFTKGCYLGQEIVARMHSLGKPKQVVRAFRMESAALPEEGARVFASGDGGAMGEDIGVVTSSTISPMLGAACIGFATARYASAACGTKWMIGAEGRLEGAVVQPQLAAIRKGERPREEAP